MPIKLIAMDIDGTLLDSRSLLPPENARAITEAADLLRTPIATLRYWRHLGTGPRSFRLGRHVLYRTGDLHAWIRAQHDAPDQ